MGMLSKYDDNANPSKSKLSAYDDLASPKSKLAEYDDYANPTNPILDTLGNIFKKESAEFKADTGMDTTPISKMNAEEYIHRPLEQATQDNSKLLKGTSEYLQHKIQQYVDAMDYEKNPDLKKILTENNQDLDVWKGVATAASEAGNVAGWGAGLPGFAARMATDPKKTVEDMIVPPVEKVYNWTKAKPEEIASRIPELTNDVENMLGLFAMAKHGLIKVTGYEPGNVGEGASTAEYTAKTGLESAGFKETGAQSAFDHAVRVAMDKPKDPRLYDLPPATREAVMREAAAELEKETEKHDRLAASQAKEGLARPELATLALPKPETIYGEGFTATQPVTPPRGPSAAELEAYRPPEPDPATAIKNLTGDDPATAIRNLEVYPKKIADQVGPLIAKWNESKMASRRPYAPPQISGETAPRAPKELMGDLYVPPIPPEIAPKEGGEVSWEQYPEAVKLKMGEASAYKKYVGEEPLLIKDANSKWKEPVHAEIRTNAGIIDEQHPGFLKELQPKITTGVSNRPRVEFYKNHFDRDAYDHNIWAGKGPFVADENGMLLSGRTRRLALKELYEGYKNGEPRFVKAINEYRQYLYDSIDKYKIKGVTGTDIDRMIENGEMPMLIETIDRKLSDAEKIQYSHDMDTSGESAFSPAENAMKIQMKMGDDLLDTINFNKDGGISLRNNDEFFRRYPKLFTEAEWKGRVGADGEMTPKALEELKEVLLAKAIPNTSFQQLVLESMDENIKRVCNGIRKAIIPLASIKSSILDISNDLGDTAVDLARMKNTEGSFLRNYNDYMSQEPLPGMEENIPLKKELMRFLAENGDSEGKVAEGLTRYADGVKNNMGVKEPVIKDKLEAVQKWLNQNKVLELKLPISSKGLLLKWFSETPEEKAARIDAEYDRIQKMLAQEKAARKPEEEADAIVKRGTDAIEDLRTQIKKEAKMDTTEQDQKLIASLTEQNRLKADPHINNFIERLRESLRKPLKERMMETGEMLFDLGKSLIAHFQLPAYSYFGDEFIKVVEMRRYTIPKAAIKLYGETGLTQARSIIGHAPKSSRVKMAAYNNGFIPDDLPVKDGGLTGAEKATAKLYSEATDKVADFIGIPREKRLTHYVRRAYENDFNDVKELLSEKNPIKRWLNRLNVPEDTLAMMEVYGDIPKEAKADLRVGPMKSYAETPRKGNVGYSLDLMWVTDQLVRKVLEEKMLKPVVDDLVKKMEEKPGMAWYKEQALDFAMQRPRWWQKAARAIGNDRFNAKKLINNLMGGDYQEALAGNLQIVLYHGLAQFPNIATQHPLYALEGIFTGSKELTGLAHDTLNVSMAAIKSLSLTKGIETSEIMSDPRTRQALLSMSHVDTLLHQEFGNPVFAALKKYPKIALDGTFNTTMYFIRGGINNMFRMEFLDRIRREGGDPGAHLAEAYEYGIRRTGDMMGRFGSEYHSVLFGQLPGGNMFLSPAQAFVNSLIRSIAIDDVANIRKLCQTAKDKGFLHGTTVEAAKNLWRDNWSVKLLIFQGLTYFLPEQWRDKKKNLLSYKVFERLHPWNSFTATMKLKSILEFEGYGGPQVWAARTAKALTGAAIINPQADYKALGTLEPWYDAFPWVGVRQIGDWMTGLTPERRKYMMDRIKLLEKYHRL